MERYAPENDTISITHTHTYINMCVCECDSSLCISRIVHTDQFHLFEYPHPWCQLDMLCQIFQDINIHTHIYKYIYMYLEDTSAFRVTLNVDETSRHEKNIYICPGEICICPGEIYICPGEIHICPGEIYICPGEIHIIFQNQL